MVSPYLTTDALDAQSTSGNEVAPIWNTMNSRLDRKLWYDSWAGKFVLLWNLTTDPGATKQTKVLVFKFIYTGNKRKLWDSLNASLYVHVCSLVLLSFRGWGVRQSWRYLSVGFTRLSYLLSCYTSPEEIEKFCDGRPRLPVLPLPPSPTYTPSRPNPPIDVI